MLSPDSITWLADNYPGLIVSQNQEEVNGQLTLTATYNFVTGTFLNLSNGQLNTISGEVLSGGLIISISNLLKRSYSDFPALFVNNPEIHKIQARHFNQSDQSACLCGPMQEKIFLSNRFNFGIFFEQLVVPFLYGQLYFNEYEKWPWPELEHGSTGALESYYFDKDSVNVVACIKALKIDALNWLRIEKYLLNRKPIKGHTPCFCGSGQPIRKCHPDAWYGFIKLKQDILKQEYLFTE